MFQNIRSKFNQNTLIKNISGLTLFQIFSSLLSFLVLPFLANNLGIQAFGFLMFILLINNYFNWIVQWGFYTGGTRDTSVNRKDTDKINNLFCEIYSSQLFLILITSIPYIFVILYFIKAEYFNELSYFLIFFSYIGFNLLPIWFFNGIEKINFGVLIQIYPKICILFSAFLFIEDANDINHYFLSNIVGQVIAIIHIIYALKKIHINFFIKNPIKQLRKNYELFISSISLSLSNNTIPFLIGFLISKEILAIFIIAERIKSLFLLMLNPIYQATFPRVCMIYNDQRNTYQSFIKQLFLIMFSFILILIMISFFNIDLIIQKLFKNEFNQSSQIFRLILPAITLNFFNSFIYYFIFIPQGHDSKLMLINVFTFLITLIFSTILIYNFALIGGAYSVVLSELVVFTFMILLYFKSKKQ